MLVSIACRILPLIVLVASGGLADAFAAEPASIAVEPTDAKLIGNLSRLQLLVTGKSSDGHEFDLTRTSDYQSLSPGILDVSKTGRVVPLSSGTGRIRVRHGKLVADVGVTVSGILPQPDVSFREDVIPVLSRAGCNQGTCHASQYGKGGMKLSLFGFAPEQDHTPLVRERRGRRVSLVRPADSLILRKPTMQIGHGGANAFGLAPTISRF